MASKALDICLSIVKWAPVVFITAVVVWSYYAYVLQMCIFTIESIPEKVIYLIFYHPLLIMFAWAYWKTIFTHTGVVPKEFYLSMSDLDRFERAENEDIQRDILARLSRNLPVQCRTTSGAVRYCEKCKCIKPDRCHHCSACSSCVLKMDHHCPWVNNCVNFTNYKFFILFLGYALLYCLFVAATSLQYFIKFWTNIGGTSKTSVAGSLHIVFLFFASVMFAISVLSLFGYHLFLVSVNRSTLESFRAPVFRGGPDKDGFSMGRRGNFQEVFGDDPKLWALPIFSSLGDGVQFSTRVQHPTPSYNSMESTNQPNSGTLGDPENPPVTTTTTKGSTSFGDGVTFPIRTVDEDYDRLLSDRQRWMEEGEGENSSDNNIGYENKAPNLHNPI